MDFAITFGGLIVSVLSLGIAFKVFLNQKEKASTEQVEKMEKRLEVTERELLLAQRARTDLLIELHALREERRGE